MKIEAITTTVFRITLPVKGHISNPTLYSIEKYLAEKPLHISHDDYDGVVSITYIGHSVSCKSFETELSHAIDSWFTDEFPGFTA